MINFNKTILGLAGAASLLAAASSAAMAQQITFASASGSGSPAAQSVVFTYSGGPNGQFTTNPSAIFLAGSYPSTDPGASLTFTGFTTTGMATGAGTAIDPYKQELSSGTFLLKSATGTDLLSGSFGSGDILTAALPGATTSSITNQVNNVVYDSTSSYFAASGLDNPGSFSLQMTSFAPQPSLTNGYLNSFTAGGGATFSAQTIPSAVPEPATVVPFLFGGLGLLALAVRKTRKAASITA